MTRTFTLAALSVLAALTFGTTASAAPLTLDGSVAIRDGTGLPQTAQYHYHHRRHHHHHGGGYYGGGHHHGWGHHRHFRPHHHHGWGHHHHHRRHHHHF
ncbi:hypothetical protein [Methylobacterium gnaphalii]|uniref:hypothetical protein n=1 Tax=Methylobacterium gnaphalii TaxID=1010610 RepID=UPI0011BD5D28|nr:hypothetical protein [Methylobacterium gnaphalii]